MGRRFVGTGVITAVTALAALASGDRSERKQPCARRASGGLGVLIPAHKGQMLPLHGGTTSSLNWSGYAVTPGSGVTAVDSTFTVPSAGLDPPGFAATWTGIGGLQHQRPDPGRRRGGLAPEQPPAGQSVPGVVRDPPGERDPDLQLHRRSQLHGHAGRPRDASTSTTSPATPGVSRCPTPVSGVGARTLPTAPRSHPPNGSSRRRRWSRRPCWPTWEPSPSAQPRPTPTGAGRTRSRPATRPRSTWAPASSTRPRRRRWPPTGSHSTTAPTP